MRGFFLSLVLALVCLAMPAAAQAQSASGLDLDSIDRSVDPCTDFYQYACAGWRTSNPLPADRPRYARFDEIQERNLVTLREVLEEASASSDPTQKKAGDFYASCMDEEGINRKGIEPIAGDLKAIASLRSKAELLRYVAASHRRGVPAFFGFGSAQDGKDSSKVIGGFGQGGLGMPNRDYYFDESERMKEVRTKYQAFMEKMLTLAGDSPAAAKSNAATIYAIEKSLAEASWRPEELKDPLKTYNPRGVGELRKLSPDVDLNGYLAALGAPAMQTVTLNVPTFFTRVSEVVKQRPMDDLKQYLRWQLLITAAPMLSKEIDDTNFDFFNRALAGQKEQRPRWKRCVNRTSFALTDAVGTGYVARKYGPEARRRMAEMIDHLKVALSQSIDELAWMSPATKKQAQEKLAIIRNKIGSPEKLRDYSRVTIGRDNLFANQSAANEFEFQRDLNKIGKPVDKLDWQMPAFLVNAYFDPQNNDINFPAGILQPPFFSATADDAVNYGGIGMVIGHEFTHGFDDSGRKFDKDGNLKDWWTADDAKAYEERAACMVDQYSSYTVVGDVKGNGKLTLGDDVADNGGLRIALRALLNKLGSAADQKVDGFNATQRYFLAFAQGWCSNETEEFARFLTKVDAHSLPKQRVIIPVSNMEEFRQAFGCKKGQPMAAANACRIW